MSGDLLSRIYFLHVRFSTDAAEELKRCIAEFETTAAYYTIFLYLCVFLGFFLKMHQQSDFIRRRLSFDARPPPLTLTPRRLYAVQHFPFEEPVEKRRPPTNVHVGLALNRPMIAAAWPPVRGVNARQPRGLHSPPDCWRLVSIR